MEVRIHALYSTVGHLDGSVFNLHSLIALTPGKETGVPYLFGAAWSQNKSQRKIEH